MKVYRIIVIIVAVILSISFSVFLFFTPTVQAAIHEPVTEEYYELLKENALEVAETLDKTVVDETLTADFYFNGDKLVVTVESVKARLTAKIPVSIHSLDIENGTIILNGTAEFENVLYEKENFLLPIWLYMMLISLLGIVIGYAIYFFFFKVWNL